MSNFFVLNFHGIGDASRPYEPGEQPYWLSRRELTDVLDLVLDLEGAPGVALTVDDGNSSDYAVLAPELQKRGLTATFFVLAGKLDRPGYLKRSEVRELALGGFEIGSHGMRHIDWARCDDASLVCELGRSKEILESVIGKPVTAAAVPFGSYDRRVLNSLARAGYRKIFSSDGGPRLTGGWPTPRQTLQTGVDVRALADQIGSRALGVRARSELRVLAKSWLPTKALRASRQGSVVRDDQSICGSD
jgi:peptidoglycan/xylan/chitin deacetylase (PgdA/CDA1 family)